MEIEVIKIPGKEWDAFAARYTGNIFFRSVWGRVLEKGLGAKLHYCCFREGGKIVGGAPGIIFGYWNLKLYYSSLYYGGYIGEKRHAEVFYSELVKHLKARDLRVDIAYFIPALFDSVVPKQNDMGINSDYLHRHRVENAQGSGVIFQEGGKAKCEEG